MTLRIFPKNLSQFLAQADDILRILQDRNRLDAVVGGISFESLQHLVSRDAEDTRVRSRKFGCKRIPDRMRVDDDPRMPFLKDRNMKQGFSRWPPAPVDHLALRVEFQEFGCAHASLVHPAGRDQKAKGIAMQKHAEVAPGSRRPTPRMNLMDQRYEFQSFWVNHRDSRYLFDGFGSSPPRPFHPIGPFLDHNPANPAWNV